MVSRLFRRSSLMLGMRKREVFFWRLNGGLGVVRIKK